ncbi:MAG: hypothetical protein JO227_14845 [Acetobacteraceae bacterium]|nr:hypothetical protein [Acetobacteraceae bacterium]
MDLLTAGGVLGAFIVLAAYFANQFDWLQATNWRFPLANLIGAVLILGSFYAQWNLPAALIEAAWAVVSLIGFVRRVRA